MRNFHPLALHYFNTVSLHIGMISGRDKIELPNQDYLCDPNLLSIQTQLSHDNLAHHLNAISNAIEKMGLFINGMKSDLNNVASRVTASGDKLTALGEAADAATQQADAFLVEAARHGDVARALEEDMTALGAIMNRDANDANARIGEAVEMIRVCDDAHTDLRTSVVNLEPQVDRLLVGLRGNDEAIRQLRDSLGALAQKQQQLLHAGVAQIADLDLELPKAEDELSALRTDIAAFHHESTSLIQDTRHALERRAASEREYLEEQRQRVAADIDLVMQHWIGIEDDAGTVRTDVEAVQGLTRKAAEDTDAEWDSLHAAMLASVKEFGTATDQRTAMLLAALGDVDARRQYIAHQVRASGRILHELQQAPEGLPPTVDVAGLFAALNLPLTHPVGEIVEV